ncbi:hypothetical protein A1C_03420 [Rickettsia akari str. Hartford]|uniref:Uncharacterized protein n=1 Tax=Rickettsia akari (strain Hartford) TaxID=293614 RepID=A8GNJ5_RICAH|nr:hypothetical protein A1C_03420 [Rickettsia akari str. Hartford]
MDDIAGFIKITRYYILIVNKKQIDEVSFGKEQGVLYFFDRTAYTDDHADQTILNNDAHFLN